MRFYQEVWGIIWEFNSLGEWLAFVAGRITAVILVIVVAYVLCLIYCPELITFIVNFAKS